MVGYTAHNKKWAINGILNAQGKPILRNLSDLTKEIEHNGEKFTPCNKLADIVTNDWDIEDMECDVQIIKDYFTMHPTDWPYWLIQKLFEWHFDVFGLIEKQLAVDINTI